MRFDIATVVLLGIQAVIVTPTTRTPSWWKDLGHRFLWRNKVGVTGPTSDFISESLHPSEKYVIPIETKPVQVVPALNLPIKAVEADDSIEDEFATRRYKPVSDEDIIGRISTSIPAASPLRTSPIQMGRISLISPTVENYIDSDNWCEYDPFSGTDFPATRETPNGDKWYTMLEDIPIGLAWPNELIELDSNALYMRDRVSVYNIKFPPELENSVIKYHLFCGDDSDPIEPTVREGFFLKILEELTERITHKLIYMSGPIEAPEEPNVATRGKLLLVRCPDPDDDDHSLLPHNHGMVRYMITEKIGMSVKDYAKSRAKVEDSRGPDGFGGFGEDIGDAFKLTAQMILLLKRLHAQNILHGDTHWGNFAFDNEGDDLIIIDFGRARFIDLDEYAESVRERGSDPQWRGLERVQNDEDDPYIWHGCHISMWETYYALPSFRDDIFKVIQSLAFMMHGSQYTRMLWNLCGETSSQDIQLRREYYRYIHHWNIFDTEIPYRNPSTGRINRLNYVLENILPWDNVRESRRRLLRILDIVRGMKIHEIPPYDEIVNELLHLVRLSQVGSSFPNGQDLKDAIRVYSGTPSIKSQQI